MILFIKKSELSNRAINALKENRNEKNIYQLNVNAELFSEEIKDSTLYIIDLEADGSFQRSYSAEELTRILVDKRIPSSIVNINLLIADVSSEKYLDMFASELNVRLRAALDRDIPIKIISDLNHKKAFLSPPKTPEEKWQVFAFKMNAARFLPQPQHGNHNFEFYYDRPEKQLLWEGSNLDEWLNHESRTFEKMKELNDGFETSFTNFCN